MGVEIEKGVWCCAGERGVGLEKGARCVELEEGGVELENGVWGWRKGFGGMWSWRADAGLERGVWRMEC